ncbi:MAG TPA: GIY-YIG nuclease family protein [Candidatus Baltobacteraceae bacterium]|nr:GIY-YIG nuclease family protein [Candidatus Baltobacteraceae bacterium]
MIIKAYGLFWRRDEIYWTPGAGNKSELSDQFRLLGRRGKNKPGLRVCDFRTQRGIYILYGDLGAHYVGLTRQQDLGKRLKDHTSDEHYDRWDRFSWFGFRSVLGGKDAYGFHKLKQMPKMHLANPSAVIGDIEALLIKAMALRNKSNMNFTNALKWEQIRLDEIDKFCS